MGGCVGEECFLGSRGNAGSFDIRMELKCVVRGRLTLMNWYEILLRERLM